MEQGAIPARGKKGRKNNPYRIAAAPELKKRTKGLKGTTPGGLGGGGKLPLKRNNIAVKRTRERRGITLKKGGRERDIRRRKKEETIRQVWEGEGTSIAGSQQNKKKTRGEGNELKNGGREGSCAALWRWS